tara:strand:+ start:623 stop:778 length:156 start_codon:yes stop_codon:yes gene_type:complete
MNLWLELKGGHWYPHLTAQSLQTSVDGTTECVDEYTGGGNWLCIFAKGEEC